MLCFWLIADKMVVFNFTSQLLASLNGCLLLLQTRACYLPSSWIQLIVSQYSQSSFFGLRKEDYTFRGPFVRRALKSLMKKKRLYLSGNFELFTVLSGVLISKGIPILGIESSCLYWLPINKERTNSSYKCLQQVSECIVMLLANTSSKSLVYLCERQIGCMIINYWNMST